MALGWQRAQEVRRQRHDPHMATATTSSITGDTSHALVEAEDLISLVTAACGPHASLDFGARVHIDCSDPPFPPRATSATGTCDGSILPSWFSATVTSRGSWRGRNDRYGRTA